MLAYIQSSKLDLEEERIPKLKTFLGNEMKKAGGVLRITKDSGIFISSKTKNDAPG